MNIRTGMIELDNTYTRKFATITTHHTLTNGMNIEPHQ